jgi:phosphoglucosamine mutase
MSTPPVRFGTDGIRGPYGIPPITEADARQIGRAVAAWCGGDRPAVLIGRDTRASGPSLARAIADGVAEAGGLALDAGVLPTAALSALVPARGGAAGVMVTASHNPAADNGVKVLGPDGKKPADQHRLEALIVDAPTRPGGAKAAVDAPLGPWEAAMPRVDLRGVRILLDAAHGAAAACGPALLRALGADVVLRGCDPDGQNINDGVGALHPPSAAEVKARGAALAICLDGDADRVVLVCPDAGRIDGDDLLWLLSAQVDGPLVGTVMSNGGLDLALGGRLRRSAVGDAHVAAEMAATGARVGAEPSGHVLFTDGLPTGDGLYAALRALQASAGPGGAPRLPLPVGGWTRWPQAQRSVRSSGPRPPLEALAALQAARAAGLRLVVRYSGTEPLLRILVEGPDPASASAAADAIAAEFRARVGG